MAEEFQAGVCGETWWNSSRNSLGLSPCSTAINNMGSFGWPSDSVDMKARTEGLILFQDIQKPQEPDSCGSVFMDSTLQMMDIGRSSSSTTRATDWNQTLLSGSGRSERNYHSSMVQEDMNSRLNFQQEPGMDCPQIQKEWSMKSFSVGGGQNSTINEFKQTNQGFSLDEPCLNSLTGSGNCTETSQGFPTSFPMNSVSCGNPSTLLQTLFDNDSPPQQSQFDNWSMNYPSTTNYQTNMNEFSPCLPKFSHLQRPSLPKQQPISPLHLKNSTPFWNASTAALNDIRASFFPSTQGEFLATMFEEKSSCPNLAAKPENEAVQDSDSMAKKSSIEPAFKRPRIETPSLLPTFKVRKEKLGDRITALQQLVSPFGKTDTASVLHEAIEYIKFLHDQVSVLNSPYMKNGAPTQHQQISDNLNPEAPKQDLRSRGLCLVPISSTFPVATETTADFWTPTFGGTFR